MLLAIKDCLETWGHHRLLVDFLQRVRGEAEKSALEVSTVVTLAWSHYRMGQQQLAFPLFEEAPRWPAARATEGRRPVLGWDWDIATGTPATVAPQLNTMRRCARLRGAVKIPEMPPPQSDRWRPSCATW